MILWGFEGVGQMMVIFQFRGGKRSIVPVFEVHEIAGKSPRLWAVGWLWFAIAVYRGEFWEYVDAARDRRIRIHI